MRFGDIIYMDSICFITVFIDFGSSAEGVMLSYKRLLVASSKGGVGKSTTALGLASALASMTGSDKEEPLKVLLVDLDVNSRSLDILAGCDDCTVYDFADLVTSHMKSAVDVSRVAVSSVGGIGGLSLIRACTADKLDSLADELDTDRYDIIRRVLDRIIAEGEQDILICDTGGGLESACAVADRFDFTAVTSEQSRTSVRSAEYAAVQLTRAGAENLRLVICSFDLYAVKKEKRAGVIEMIDSSSLQCVGVVPFDRKLQSAQDKGVLPKEKSDSQSAYRNIAKRILGYDVPLFSGIRSHAKKKRFAL